MDSKVQANLSGIRMLFGSCVSLERLTYSRRIFPGFACYSDRVSVSERLTYSRRIFPGFACYSDRVSVSERLTYSRRISPGFACYSDRVSVSERLTYSRRISPRFACHSVRCVVRGNESLRDLLVTPHSQCIAVRILELKPPASWKFKDLFDNGSASIANAGQ